MDYSSMNGSPAQFDGQNALIVMFTVLINNNTVTYMLFDFESVYRTFEVYTSKHHALLWYISYLQQRFRVLRASSRLRLKKLPVRFEARHSHASQVPQMFPRVHSPRKHAEL